MSKYDGRPDQIVFITGMHRSGASFLAHALSLCGLDMGKNHDGSDWEDRDFVRMNDAILAEAERREGLIIERKLQLGLVKKMDIAMMAMGIRKVKMNYSSNNEC